MFPVFFYQYQSFWCYQLDLFYDLRLEIKIKQIRASNIVMITFWNFLKRKQL